MMLKMWKGHVRRVVQAGAVVVATLLFLYQVSFLMVRYLAYPTTTSVSLALPTAIHMPPLLICPQQPFNMEALKDLGLDVVPHPGGSVMDNIATLRGLDPGLAAEQVWREAGITLGHMVHSFTFGQIEENYTTATLSSRYWRQVTTPIGPCQALLLPSVSFYEDELPSVTVTLNKVSQTSTCPIGMRECSQEMAREMCNSTCEFEDLFSIFRSPYYVLLGRVYPREGRDVSQELDDSLRFLLAEDAWHVTSLGFSSTPLNVVQVDTVIVDRRPFHCEHDTRQSPGADFSTCMESYLQESEGCLPVQPASNVTLGASCTVSVVQGVASGGQVGEAGCRGPLLGWCRQRQWVHDEKRWLNLSAFTTIRYQVLVSLTSPKIREEVEEAMYPLFQLASDVGGSLGLCLGMSLLTVWLLLTPQPHHLIPKATFQHEYKNHHFCQLLHWCVLACLAFFTALHCCLSLHLYIAQTVRVTVARATTAAANTDTIPDTDPSTTALIIQDHVAARLASRALDCRPGPQLPAHQCVLKCLMTEALKQVNTVAPFVHVDDLPICPSKHGWQYSPKYVVPSLALATTTDPILMQHCRQQCEGIDLLNISAWAPPQDVEVNHQYYYITVTDFICSLGGIVSLYAGVFLSSAVPAVVGFLPDTSSQARFLKRVVQVTMKLAISISGAAMTVLIFYRYIFDHPISSKAIERPLAIKEQPHLTLCHWPPFTEVLENNLSVPLDDAWAAAGWGKRVSRVTITQGPGRLTDDTGHYTVTSAVTPINLCETVMALVDYSNMVVSLFYWWDGSQSAVVSLHGPRDPPFSSQVYQVKMFETVTLSVVPARYVRLSSQPHSARSYTTCLYTCLHNTYSDRLGCRLPFITWRPNLPLCTLQVARQYPWWPEEGAAPPETMIKSDGYQTCHAHCRHQLTEFYFVQAGTTGWIESSVNVVQQRSSFANLCEEDWYSLSHVANQLTVVAGFTFGTSILSLLQYILLKWLHCR